MVEHSAKKKLELEKLKSSLNILSNAINRLDCSESLKFDAIRKLNDISKFCFRAVAEKEE